MRRGIKRSAVGATALAVVSALMFAASPATAARRCAGGASSLSLRSFAQATQPYFYFTPESGDGTFVVGGAIDRGNAFASYTTPSGSPLGATPGSDYTSVSGTITFENDVNDCLAVQESRDVPVTNDSQIDAGGVEELIVSIQVQNASAGVTQAPMYIVDDEGPVRVRMPEPAQLSISEPLGSGSSTARIPVLRAGSGGGTVTWSINDPGNDVSPDSGTLGTGIFQQIQLSITNDTADEPNETLTLTLSAQSPAQVEGDNTFSLTILDTDSGGGGGGGGDNVPPDAWFHHPKHNRTYGFNTFLANTIHLFATDNEGEPNITGGQLAIRKKMNGGACKWWKGGRWRNGGCTRPKWIGLGSGFDDGTRRFWAYARYPTLAPSVGTRIRNYQVLGRAFDTDGNRSPLETGDNRNTFEITRN